MTEVRLNGNGMPMATTFMPWIGTQEDGRRVVLDIVSAPHALIAGMTGSGKSSLMNAVLLSLYVRQFIDELVIVLIDPKRVELAPYADAPHTWKKKVFYEPRDAVHALEAMNMHMDQRFKEWGRYGRNIDEVNNKLMVVATDTFDLWPRVVIVIDELANLILDRTYGKRVEELLVRIASMGRAAGIHLLLATQRPSADVITGLIRANVPTRLCLPVATKMESRIVLDVTGAEELPGPGHVLARLPGERQLVRFKSEYVSGQMIDREIAAVIARGGDVLPEMFHPSLTVTMGPARTHAAGRIPA